jgi:hypothetical protein
MIISCPECAGPFEVPDDRIAALVQVACPRCAFRMILDFAAANDHGLVEQGMRMASGFRSAADYHASVQLAASPEPPEPELEVAQAVADEPAIVTEPVSPAAPPVRTRPERIAAAEPPVRTRPEPVSPAAAPPRPLAPTPSLEPVRPAAEVSARPRREASEEARTEVHMLPLGAEKRVPVDIPPAPRRPVTPVDEDDIAVNVPAPATEIVRNVVEPAPASDEVAIDFDDEDEAEPAVTVAHPPMRTPPSAQLEGRRPAQASATAAERAAHPAFGDEEEEDDAPTMIVPPEAREVARREMEAERDALAAARAAAGRTRVPEPVPEADPTAGRERPRPPHTPPGRAKVTARPEDDAERSGGRSLRRPGDEAETKRPLPAPAESPDLDDDDAEEERMSTVGVVLVVLLLLIAVGLVGASIATSDDRNPDPRPLLEKLYRQYVKGQPVQ